MIVVAYSKNNKAVLFFPSLLLSLIVNAMQLILENPIIN